MVAQSLLFFRTGYRSLLVHKFRSFLSVLGIVCGVMAVMAMISTGEGAKQEVLGRIEKMGLKNIYIEQIELTEELKKQMIKNHFDTVIASEMHEKVKMVSIKKHAAWYASGKRGATQFRQELFEEKKTVKETVNFVSSFLAL